MLLYNLFLPRSEWFNNIYHTRESKTHLPYKEYGSGY